MTEAGLKAARFTTGWFLRTFGWLIVGIFLGWYSTTFKTPPQAIEIVDTYDASESSFSAPNSIDIVTDFKRQAVCPARTQRWIWHKIQFQGQEVTQVVPLSSTLLPFFAADGTIIVTMRIQGITDPKDNWFERSVSEERCPLLPAWMSWLPLYGMLTTDHLYRSKDIPISFTQGVDNATAR